MLFYWLVCVEPSLHHWDEAYLITVNDIWYVLEFSLQRVLIYLFIYYLFILAMCASVFSREIGQFYSSCCLFIWLQCQCNTGFIEGIWKCLFLFLFYGTFWISLAFFYCYGYICKIWIFGNFNCLIAFGKKFLSVLSVDIEFYLFVCFELV